MKKVCAWRGSTHFPSHQAVQSIRIASVFPTFESHKHLNTVVVLPYAALQSSEPMTLPSYRTHGVLQRNSE